MKRYRYILWGDLYTDEGSSKAREIAEEKTRSINANIDSCDVLRDLISGESNEASDGV